MHSNRKWWYLLWKYFDEYLKLLGQNEEHWPLPTWGISSARLYSVYVSPFSGRKIKTFRYPHTHLHWYIVYEQLSRVLSPSSGTNHRLDHNKFFIMARTKIDIHTIHYDGLGKKSIINLYMRFVNEYCYWVFNRKVNKSYTVNESSAYQKDKMLKCWISFVNANETWKVGTVKSS